LILRLIFLVHKNLIQKQENHFYDELFYNDER